MGEGDGFGEGTVCAVERCEGGGGVSLGGLFFVGVLGLVALGELRRGVLRGLRSGGGGRVRWRRRVVERIRWRLGWHL